MNNDLTSSDPRYNQSQSPVNPLPETRLPAAPSPRAAGSQLFWWLWEGVEPILLLAAAAGLIYWIGVALQSWRVVVTG